MIVVFTVNGPFQPMDRGDIFEDPLDEWLAENGGGEVVGGGTQLSDEGEIEACDIEVELASEHQLPGVVDFFNRRPSPKGSRYLIGETSEPFGHAEILALYLNGRDLPKDVYQNNSAQDVFEGLTENLEDSGMILGHWQGPTETALYMFGTDIKQMKARVADFVASHPLCQKSRLVHRNAPAAQ